MDPAVDYATMSYRELQALCKKHGLNAKGKTDELRARLAAAKSAVAEEHNHMEEEEEDEDPLPSAKHADVNDIGFDMPDLDQGPPQPQTKTSVGEEQEEEEEQDEGPGTVPRPPAQDVAPATKKRNAAAMQQQQQQPTAMPQASVKVAKPIMSMLRKPSLTATFAAQAAQAQAAQAKKTASTVPAVALKTTTAMISSSTKKPKQKVRPFGPGTYALTSNQPLAANPKSAAPVPSSSAALPLKPKAVAAFDPTLVKPRPKLGYKPHTGKLPPWGGNDSRNVSLFSPHPVMPPPKAAVPKQRPPHGLGKSGNGAAVTGAGSK